ncbi:diacylglycerol/lipid kinase family protein [Virgibacillus doumboii]|uniref:diacylglycerol/lipid kinase family protein n=1 Tax=Virgibacillus doumboii TaxID=2697503 RepID=UPI0013E006D3|nr:diacylglycerol kinase family protein [Virgibacillus doumboii]
MYIFIVNPASGKGGAVNAYTKITKSNNFIQVESRCFLTEYPGHAEEIANQLETDFSGQISCVIVIGGDGTLHEVINGLSENKYPVSFIPAGSGNDFAKGCDIKGSPTEIFQRIITGRHQQSYWLGSYQRDNNNKRDFVNSIGFGFDGEIVKYLNESKESKFRSIFVRGKVRYVIALIIVLFRFKPMNVEVNIDGNRRMLTDCWMITAANHPFYGGGMKIIPSAKIQDGTFPVLIINKISKWKVLGLFITVFTGKHIRFKEVELLEATKLEIRSDNTISFQVDGQLDACSFCSISKQGQEVKISY